MRLFKGFFIFILLLVGRLSIAQEVQQSLFLSFEQKTMISYALLAQGQDEEKKIEIYSRAREFLKKNLAKGSKIIAVRNFEEFMTHFRGEWPNTNSLDYDMLLIEAREARGWLMYKSESPRIQRQIDQFIVSQIKSIVQLTKQEKQLSSTLKQAIESSKLLEPSQITEFVNLWKLGNKEGFQLKTMMTVFNISDAIIERQISQIDRIGEKVANSDLGESSDPMVKVMLETMLTQYFSRLSPETKKQIIATFLGGNLYSNDLQKFEMLIQNSGPQLQKMLQVVARQGGISEKMLEVFRGLESAVKQVPWVQVEKILSQEHGNYDFKYFERKPLGVGTMAQVHRAKILIDGKIKDVVARFIKPDIDKRVQEDHRILTEIAKILDADPRFQATGLPEITPLVADITQTVTAELNQNDTIERQLTAKKSYERMIMFRSKDHVNNLKIHVPDLFLSKKPSKFMIQEMVLGSKLDNEAEAFKDIAPELKRVIVEEMSKVWIREVLFGSGFFHSDLHQGNFLVRFTEPSIQLNILDYGMGGSLTREIQSNSVLLGAGIQTLNQKAIAKAFWAISDKRKGRIKKVDFEILVDAKIKAIKAGHEKAPGIDMWAAWAVNNGLVMPYEFVNLNRGLAIVAKMLENAGSTETITTLAGEAASDSRYKVFKSLKTAGATLADIAKLAWEHIKLTKLAEKESSEQRQILLAPSATISCQGIF